MKVLIIEDEKPAANRLEKLLLKNNPAIVILDKIPSVKKAVEWCTLNPSPDLIFMDIQLSDGISFEIFEHCKVECPIIFTTAYDEYALKAFKVNSIDYLLKPIDEEDLKRVFLKIDGLGLGKRSAMVLPDQLAEALQLLNNKYKNRFLVKIGEHIQAVPVNDILYFYSKEKATFCRTKTGKNHLLDYSLDQLDSMVNPQDYFRVNRQYLISFESVKDIISFSNSRLKLILHHEPSGEVIVSRERVVDFKKWLDK